MLGVVLELFVVEEQLFTRCKYKLAAAIAALQDSIRKLHGRLPKEGKHREIGHELNDLPFPFPCLLSLVLNKGPGPQQLLRQ
jgi:hypothetical protein